MKRYFIYIIDGIVLILIVLNFAKLESVKKSSSERRNTTEASSEVADYTHTREITTGSLVIDEVKTATDVVGDESDVADITKNDGEAVDVRDGTNNILQGKNYTFYEVDSSKYLEDDNTKYNIRAVYENEGVDSDYHGLFVGQVVTLFGDKNVTDDNEALLSYIVAAEKTGVPVMYLEIYYGPSGPAIGGVDTPDYLAAAEELEEIIRKVEPIDYSCQSIYWDVGVTITMGTRNGKGFYESEFIDPATFDEMLLDSIEDDGDY